MHLDWSQKLPRLSSFDPDPTIRLSFWSVVLGRFFIGLGVIGTGQPSIQRYSTLKSARSAQTWASTDMPFTFQLFNCSEIALMNTHPFQTDFKYRSALLNAPAIAVMYTLTCLCGLTVYAYYADKGCDPLNNGEITSSNQVKYIAFQIAW